MPATPIPTAERFFAPEISKVYFALTAGATGVLTREEIDASHDITEDIVEIAGWTVTTAMIATAGMSRFAKQLPGRTTAADSSITFAADISGQDIRTILARGDRGFVIFCDGGDVTGYLADRFPVQVRGVPKPRTLGDQEFRVTVEFAITGVPDENLVIPA